MTSRKGKTLQVYNTSTIYAHKLDRPENKNH